MKMREFGRCGIFLSQVVFGSMRLDPKTIDASLALRLINYLYDNGVTCFHSSHEYESYDFFCDLLKRFRLENKEKKITHIVKLAEPSFDQCEFNAHRFCSLIEDQIKRLSTERIDVVQWLLRYNTKDDNSRVEILSRAENVILDTCEKLRQAGKIGAVAVYPYSTAFAFKAMQTSFVDGIADNLNLLETKTTVNLKELAVREKGFLAIRPLAAGLLKGHYHGQEAQKEGLDHLKNWFAHKKIDRKDILSFSVRFPLLHPSVSAIIISMSSLTHTTEILNACAEVSADEEKFWNIVRDAQAGNLSDIEI